MRKFTAILVALVFFPALAMSAALLQGMVEKVDKDKNQIVLKTEKGSETVEFNSRTKGADKAKVGARVTIMTTQEGEKLVASEIDTGTGKDSSPKGSPSDRPVTPGGMERKSPAGAE